MTLAIQCETYFQNSIPPDAIWETYKKLNDLFIWMDAKPNFVSLSTVASGVRLISAGSKPHRTFEATCAKSSTGFGLVCSPSHSDAPGFDWVVNAGINCDVGLDQATLYLSVRENFAELYEAIADKFFEIAADISTWDYGFGAIDHSDRRLEDYIGGGANEYTTNEEWIKLQQWTNCYQPEIRNKLLRDVFHYNLLTERHLENSANIKMPLKELIKSENLGLLSALQNGNYLWRLNDASLKLTRYKLMNYGFLICQ